MATEVLISKEDRIKADKKRVADFIKNMVHVKLDHFGRGINDLDTYLLLTYDQLNKIDEIDFVSWSEDEERSFPSKFINWLKTVEVPENKNHPPYPNEFTIPNRGEKVPVLAFGAGPGGKAFVFRLKGMNTAPGLERIKKAVGLKPFFNSAIP